MRAEPLVSVCMVTYNHAKYIAEAIRSVLGQTLPDLELVVVDDGSTDATPEVVASFRDPRMVVVRQPNSGPSVAANRAIGEARGRYVALMSGDDVCYPERLRLQMDEYKLGSGRLLFSAVNFIDEHGNPLQERHFADGIFDVVPMNKAQILERFFFRGNFINSITTFSERQVFLREGLWDPLLLQLQDFEMWVRLVKKYDFCFLRQPTVHYRIRASGMNLSALTPHRRVRYINEQYLILRHFFDGVSIELFREAFAAHLRRQECATLAEVACEQAFLYVNSGNALYRLIGIERLRDLLSQLETREVLARCYQFNHLSFTELLQRVDVLGTLLEHQTTLYLDTGFGFSDKELRRLPADHTAGPFSLTFDLSDTPAVRCLRWDPVELRFCRVELIEICCEHRNGRVTYFDPAAVICNGIRQPDGCCRFETLDPSFLFPVEGELLRVTVRGTWEVEETWSSALGVAQQLEVQNQEIARLRSHQEQLHGCQEQLHGCQEQLRGCQERLEAILASRSWRAVSVIRSAWRRVKPKRST